MGEDNTPAEHRTWNRSSYSGAAGGQCVEMAVAWRKSNYSGAEGGQCVEVGEYPGAVHVRDSKEAGGPSLTFAPGQWDAFLIFARTA